MTDRYSGRSSDAPQAAQLDREHEERKRYEKASKARTGKKKADEEEELPAEKLDELYAKGKELFEAKHYQIELDEEGPHYKHRILKAGRCPTIKGLSIPFWFRPYRDIYQVDDIGAIRRSVFGDLPSDQKDVRKFWEPLWNPKSGDTSLSLYADRLLKMERLQKQRETHRILDYGQSFDPSGSLTGAKPAEFPRIWVPAREWFAPELQQLKFEDVFTIFPFAERELLKLILGRVGVGRANHLPPNFENPIDHTARMAAVIVGKDPGLGKSTLFNGLTAALNHCGFSTHTFKSTADRFGMRRAALADIAYKDDTSMASLKKFLSNEETKILVTNGLMQVEEKFQAAEQLMPRCVIIVNSNDWNQNFAYDLDPGIIDRIKILSTYREHEIRRLRHELPEDSVSAGTPDLRPRAHLSYLAEKLDVSIDALYLWTLRLATDRFWEVISDTENKSENSLEQEVRQWTTRQRIRFKADVTMAMINAMAFARAVRYYLPDAPEPADDEEIPEQGSLFIVPELTPEILYDYLKSFYFVGVDPAGYRLMNLMKERWNKGGRVSTHYYAGFREIRWETVKQCYTYYSDNQNQYNRDKSHGDQVKGMMDKITMRDGFKVGGGMTYLVDNWQHMREGIAPLLEEVKELMEEITPAEAQRLRNLEIRHATDKWMYRPDYSPDRAEVLREREWQRFMDSQG